MQILEKCFWGYLNKDLVERATDDKGKINIAVEFDKVGSKLIDKNWGNILDSDTKNSIKSKVVPELSRFKQKLTIDDKYRPRIAKGMNKRKK